MHDCRWFLIVGIMAMTCTWVTAPTMRPFCKIGLPDMPCTMPPVAASSRGSVTLITMLLGAGDICRVAWVISTVYSLMPSPSMVDRMVAGPVFTVS